MAKLNKKLWFSIVILVVTIVENCDSKEEDNYSNCTVKGPGLAPHEIVLPARYFFVFSGNRCALSQADLQVELKGSSEHGRCRIWTQILDRHDGSFVVRYKMFQYCDNMEIHVTVKGEHLAQSPYLIPGRVYADSCDCPLESLNEMIDVYDCPEDVTQVTRDLQQFADVNFTQVLGEAISRFNHAGSYSFCHYVILNNKIYRRCYGQHVGFNMFMDNILLSISRKAKLPDMEFLINLGDWPLVKKNIKPVIPMFSWCGSSLTHDIVLPTYDLTESSLECMGRVTLDMLSVQSTPDKKWEDKVNKAFWRGRDSRRERLNLVKISRQRPDLINASLTNFFFFREEESIYGPKEDHVSFFKFFDFKYQLNIDGTVAAYRFPYLLAGDAVVFKQDSDYYEHFYSGLEPNVHYIPVKADLSNLIEQLEWAIEHDDEVRRIGASGRQFAVNNLLPKDIICYHAVLFKQWSEKLKNPVKVLEKMDLVTASRNADKRQENCPCLQSQDPNDESSIHSEL